MSSILTRSKARRLKRNVGSLAPEVLLKIFLSLDSHETVILRRVCKEFLEIVDNNKSLWRIMDWIQDKDGSAVQALEKFDEKNASTLKEVSIFQRGGKLDGERLLEVLRRSSKTLSCLSLAVNKTGSAQEEVIEVASGAPLLNSLTLGLSRDFWTSRFPKTRLTRSSRHLAATFQLPVLCCWNLVDWDGKLDVSSLVSFADLSYQNPSQLRSVISNFSQGIVHLAISPIMAQLPQVVSCPSLRILEGRFPYGFPSWLEAPNLQIVIASSVKKTDFFPQLPVSVEEIWLLSWYLSPENRELDLLSKVCPKLKCLKLGKDVFEDGSTLKRNLDPFSAREEKIREGIEIEGIRMRSLEKLIIPTELLEPAELDQLRDFVGEVIDIKDYPDFIELEY